VTDENDLLDADAAWERASALLRQADRSLRGGTPGIADTQANLAMAYTLYATGRQEGSIIFEPAEENR